MEDDPPKQPPSMSPAIDPHHPANNNPPAKEMWLSDHDSSSTASPVEPSKQQQLQQPSPIPLPPHDSNSSNNNPSLNKTAGSALTGTVLHFSDWVNDNLIVARYGVLASIGLLTAYGISQSPLFFRYRTVSDIPSQLFLQRRSLAGRVVKMDLPTTSSSSSQPVRCYIRHLSPWERLLPLAWVDSLWRLHPARTLQEPNTQDDLLQIQLIGIEYPATASQVAELFRQQQRVSCQLLARGLPLSSSSTSTATTRSKRAIPGWKEDDVIDNENSNKTPQIAFCKMTHYPGVASLYTPWKLLQGEDVGESLVKDGKAVLSDTGLFGNNNNSHFLKVTDFSTHHKRDVNYLSKQLVQAEFEACAHYRGVWADAQYRDARKDFVKDVVFEKEAKWWQRLWRWIRDR